MIRVVGERIAVETAMVLGNAARLVEQGNAAVQSGSTSVDLSAVTEVDSSGLAVVFAWQRAAQLGGKSLRLENPPANLLSLADLYGVSELLPLA